MKLALHRYARIVAEHYSDLLSKPCEVSEVSEIGMVYRRSIKILERHGYSLEASDIMLQICKVCYYNAPIIAHIINKHEYGIEPKESL